MESRVWYDELAGMLVDAGAEVVLKKSLTGDSSYVRLPFGQAEICIRLTSRGEFIVEAVSGCRSKEIVTVNRIETVVNVTRRALTSNLSEV